MRRVALAIVLMVLVDPVHWRIGAQTAPSWDEKYIMKTPDGKLSRGGHWAGGMAYLTCSRMAVDLARRPQNLPAVKKLCNANAYFIDTTYAAGLQECFDPTHPLTRADDLKWKQEISDYARSVFGVFGSECGREWAIPHSDFFEGLTGVSGVSYHDAGLTAKLGATVVPLFELVYRDCIAMYGKYGYEPDRAADYVLHHISLGRPLNYHSIPPHLFWTKPADEQARLGLRPRVLQLKQTSPKQFQISYAWQVDKPTSTDLMAFVHFTDGDGNIKFQNDYEPNPGLAGWATGETIQGPFTVDIPEGLSGTFMIRCGLFDKSTGTRALLKGRDNGQRSYLIGRLNVSADKVELQSRPAPAPLTPNSDVFVQADNGWAAGLHPMDRFVKNTYEVLSPLNELTARMRMTKHEFLTGDRKVERTVFGEGKQAILVTVNGGEEPRRATSRLGGDVLLPQYGFLVEGPTFIAFHALEWNGMRYSSPVLFTLRSTDGRTLEKTRQMRVFHAFGDDEIVIGKRKLSIPKEQLVPTSLGPRPPQSQS